MDQELIKKTEERIENYLFGKIKVTDIGLKMVDVTIKYLIYQQLKELNNNLSLIEEALSIKELEK